MPSRSRFDEVLSRRRSLRWSAHPANFSHVARQAIFSVSRVTARFALDFGHG
jgi:hypothetical protein